MAEDKEARMAAVARAVAELSSSPLHGYREAQGYRPVIGEGRLDARIIFIGEAPGLREARSGRPFVGAAGRVLDELLASIGLSRADVYITNIVKDRPPDNRDPTAEEVRVYRPFLRQQIEIIQPRVIATLGRFAASLVLEELGHLAAGETIGALHGRPLLTQAPYGPVTIVPLYHPAVALYNRSRRAVLESDMKVLAEQA